LGANLIQFLEKIKLKKWVTRRAVIGSNREKPSKPGESEESDRNQIDCFFDSILIKERR